MYISRSGDFGPLGDFLFFVAIIVGAIFWFWGLRVWWRGDRDWRNSILPIGEDRRYAWENFLDLLDQGVAKIQSWWRRYDR
jgi:hypothetical protein